jgi:hypothetical protein
MPICNFCSSEFKNDYLLKSHTKSAKYCLKIQESLLNNVKVEEKTFSCEFCNKKFSQAGNLKTHLNSCQDKKIQDIKNSIINEYEHKINELKSLHQKEIDINKQESNNKINELKSSHQKEIDSIKQESNNKMIVTKAKLEAELKYKSLLINDLKSQLKKLNEPKSINKSINNTTNIQVINNNQYGSIDFSQERFDKIVEEKLTYDLFIKGKFAGRQLLIDFFTDELGILRIEICDDARDKLKIIDNKNGQPTIITDITLFNKFINSETLKEYIIKYATQFANSQEYDQHSSITFSEKILFYKNESRFRKHIYTYFKDHIRQFGQLSHILDDANKKIEVSQGAKGSQGGQRPPTEP